VRTSPSDPWREIVGVVGDARENGMNKPVVPAVYFPFLVKSFWSNPIVFWSQGSLIVRTPRAGTDGLLQDMQRAVHGIDSGIPLSTPSTMGELYRRSMERTSFTLALLSVAGLMALLLGIVGLYGTIAYAVSQRTREVGIRIALGARSGEVQGMFVRQGLVLTAVGVGLGLGGAVALTRWMASLLFEVSPLDPATYVAVSVVLIVAATLASYLPSRQATRVDPIETLHAE
jgi:ABC-type antimicrobial peptide transport system permease subunit